MNPPNFLPKITDKHYIQGEMERYFKFKAKLKLICGTFDGSFQRFELYRVFHDFRA